MGEVMERSRHRVTVEDFHKMGEAGIFLEDDRVELIDGEMIDMAPIGSRHAGVAKHLTNLLAMAAKGKAIVSAQDPLRLGPHSEPEPDLMLLVPRDDFYNEAHPGASAESNYPIRLAGQRRRGYRLGHRFDGHRADGREPGTRSRAPLSGGGMGRRCPARFCIRRLPKGRWCMNAIATEEALRLLRIAKADLAACRALIGAPGVRFANAAFQGQQAVEKAPAPTF